MNNSFRYFFELSLVFKIYNTFLCLVYFFYQEKTYQMT